MKLKLVVSCLYVLLFFISPHVEAQPDSTIVLKIRDERTNEVGQYYDVADTIVMKPYTTYDYQIIPNVGIQDSVIKEKYDDDFLELLKRNLGKEPQLFDVQNIIGTPSTHLKRYEFPIKVDPGDYNDHIFGHFKPGEELWHNFEWSITSVHFDEVLIDLLNEANNKLTDYFAVNQNNPDWIFNYEGRDIISNITYDTSYNPVSAEINFRNYVLDFPNAYDELSKVITSNLLLNHDYDKNLLLLGDNDLYDYYTYPKERWSPDMVNILKVLKNLSNNTDFSKFDHEDTRVPIPKITVLGNLMINEDITLNAGSSHAFDSDHIVIYEWSQVFMENLDMVYVSSNPLTFSDTTGEQITISANWPGNYRIKLKITTDQNKSSETFADIEILMEQPRQIGLGHMMVDIWAPGVLYNIETFPQTLQALQESGGNYFAFTDIALYTQAVPVPKIENIYPPEWMTIEKDDFLYIISEVKKLGFKTLYRHSIGDYPGNSFYSEIHKPHTIDYWQVFFDELLTNYIEKAQMCEEAGVDYMVLGQINLQGFPYAQDWPEKHYHEQQWRYMIDTLRTIYSGEIGIYQAIGGQWDMQPTPISYLRIIPWLDAVDFIICYFVSPLTTENDISVEDIRIRSNRAVTSILDEFYDKFNKPVILIHWIEHIDGAATYPPYEGDGFRPGTKVSYKDAVDLFDGLMQTIITKPYIQAVIDNGYSYLDRLEYYYSRRGIGMRVHPEEQLYRVWLKIVQ
jgi:hypothetical protein